MNSDYIFQYVPDYIIRSWADENGLVPYVKRESHEVFTSPVGETFVEHLDMNSRPDDLESVNPLRHSQLIKAVEAVVNGDFSNLERDAFWFCVLFSHLYYSYPYGSGRGDTLRNIYYRELEAIRSADEKDRFLSEKWTAKRTTQDILSIRELASVSFVYGFDLTPVVLEAPAEIDYALGSNSAYFSNPSDNPRFDSDSFPLLANGVCAILPLSPRYAICLYDRNCYKMKKTGDRVILTQEDVLQINRRMTESSVTCVFSPTEKYGDEYYAHIYDGCKENVIEYPNPSFDSVRVLAKAYCIEEYEREYCRKVAGYDASFMLDGGNRMDTEAFQDRIAHALSLAGTGKE